MEEPLMNDTMQFEHVTSQGYLLDLYNSLGHGAQSVWLVVAFGILFVLLECSMTMSPVATLLLRMLRRNPKLTEAEARRCVPMIVTRIVGSIHNSIQVPIAVWVIRNADLRTNRLYGTHLLSHWMLCIAGGFFLHDAVSCFFRETPFYIVHGLTCCLGYTGAAAYGCGHFYGGLFLMWECSTPFVQLRWVLFKMGRTETTLYRVNGILMVISFGIARIFFGTYFTSLMIYDTFHELRHPTPGEDVPPMLWISFCMAALTISALNYYWFSLMVKAMWRVFLKGHSWTDISHGKNE